MFYAGMNPLTPEFSCRDLRKSLAFYVDLLGFRIKFERPEHCFAYLEREGAELMLDQIGVDRTWETGDLVPPLGRGVNLQIKVSNVEALYQRVLAAGITPFLALEEKWYRIDGVHKGNRQFLVQDPDGYLLRFAQDLGERPE